MLAEIGFAVASQGGNKPSLVWQMIPHEDIKRLGPDPSTGRAVVSKESVGIMGSLTQLPTWESPDAIMDRLAGASIGAVAVRASKADKDAAQSAYDGS